MSMKNIPSTTSCEVGGWPMRPIQKRRCSSAISSSIPWVFALLQKYVSHDCRKLKIGYTMRKMRRIIAIVKKSNTGNNNISHEM